MQEEAKILVVDDEPNIRFFLEKVLTRDGHHVTTVESGEAALALLEEQEFDVALIDLKLDGINGMKVLSTLRERAPYTSVIVLTGYASLDTAVKALRHGAHDYLFKPAKASELRESVRTGLLKRNREVRRQNLLKRLEQDLASSLGHIRSTVVKPEPSAPLADSNEQGSSNAEEERLLRHGRLIVDLTRHTVTLDGQRLNLSPTEFDVLAYLISEAPRVISPEEMVKEVQGYACEPWEARDTVRYHIYRIRSKIKEATDQEGIIRTVRGVGYGLQKAP
jgi:DNA-binding response OmpR family regulator